MLSRPSARIWLWAVGALVVLLLVTAPIATYAWVHLTNNAVSQKIEDRLLALPLPPDTQLVDSAWAAQRLAGAGNGMEYAGGLLVCSDLTTEQLAAFYDRQPGEQSVVKTDDEMIGRQTLLFDEEHDLSADNLFMVLGYGEAPSELHYSLDLRGH